MDSNSDALGPRELAERIERVHRALTGKEGGRGARAWFAREVGVKPLTVSRWVSESDSPHMRRGISARGLLRLLELEEEARQKAARKDTP